MADNKLIDLNGLETVYTDILTDLKNNYVKTSEIQSSKRVPFNANGQTIEPDYGDGFQLLRQVVVEPPTSGTGESQELNPEVPSTTISAGYYANDINVSVKVASPAPTITSLDESGKGGITATASTGFYDQVSINVGKASLDKSTISPRTTPQEVSITEGYTKAGKVLTVEAIPTETKEITADTSDITVPATSDKYMTSVTVKPTPTKDRTVNLDTKNEPQKVYPEAGYHLGQVTINPMPDATYSKEDSSTNNESIVGEITPTTSKQVVVISEGYTSAKKVTVKAMPKGSITVGRGSSAEKIYLDFDLVEEDGQYRIKATTNESSEEESASNGGINKITVEPGYVDASSIKGNFYYPVDVSFPLEELPAAKSQLKSENIKAGSSIFGVPGTYSKIPTSNASEYAVNSNILAGKKFFINGGEDAGTMANYSSTATTELTPTSKTITLDNGFYGGNKYSVKENNLVISNSDIGANGSYDVSATESFFTKVNVNLTASSATIGGSPYTFGNTISPTTSEQTVTINKGWIGEAKTIKVGKVASEARLVYTVTGSFTPSQFTGSDKTYSIQNSNIKSDSEVIIMPASSSDAANWGKSGIAVINEMINGSAKLSAISNIDTTAINYKMIIINPMN